MPFIYEPTNNTILERFGWFFNIHNVKKLNQEDGMPNYNMQMIPWFLAIIILEYIALKLAGKPVPRVNDGIMSLLHSMIYECTSWFTKGAELYAYSWMYQYRFLDLDWSSPWTWYFAALGVDFGYYWHHRMSHEIHLFWAFGHNVHHSSEDYNVTTALRQSALQKFFSIGVYHPLALLGVPLPAVLAHIQFSLFSQFWLHTEFTSDLGPIGWIFNTPSHHRVHHGMNKWCLDKNYGAFLIIWDRMFGTFEPEREDEKVVYGLVGQPQFFEPIRMQTFYGAYAIQKARECETWGDSLRSLFYGPGWRPGTGRLGDLNDLPNKTEPREKYNPQIPTWLNVYLLLHFFVLILFIQEIALQLKNYSWLATLTSLLFLFGTMYIFGKTVEGSQKMANLEALRCVTSVILVQTLMFIHSYPFISHLLCLFFSLSSIIWITLSLHQFNILLQEFSIQIYKKGFSTLSYFKDSLLSIAKTNNYEAISSKLD